MQVPFEHLLKTYVDYLRTYINHHKDQTLDFTSRIDLRNKLY